MFSSPFYLNDTIQDELDNYSYHASFENGQSELSYVNSNFLVHHTALQEDVTLSQLNMDNLTPKKWLNQPNSSTFNAKANCNFNLINHQASNTHQAGERKVITARRYLPFTSLADRNTQTVSSTVAYNNLFTNNHPFIKKRTSFDNLKIIRHNNNYLSNDAIRSKNVRILIFLKFLKNCHSYRFYLFLLTLILEFICESTRRMA